MNNIEIRPFKGIPSAYDFILCNNRYFESVKKLTIELFGENATMLQASRSMNKHGNIDFFRSFPDLFNVSKETLKDCWEPEFGLAHNNPYADYLHGLSHIRSRSSHTCIGEALLVPDNFYNIGARYSEYALLNKTKTLNECKASPYEIFDLAKKPIPHQKLHLMSIRFSASRFQDRENYFYKNIYKEGLHKVEMPTERVSNHFLTQPLNHFEDRLSHNVVRAIYMDEKFKKYGSKQTSFIHTPVSVSHKESYQLLFSNEEQDHWIQLIADAIKSDKAQLRLQKIVNTTGTHSSDAQQMAKETILLLEEFYLPKTEKIG